eukprot:1611187-Lingulodinium_polyedra.AAC.1
MRKHCFADSAAPTLLPHDLLAPARLLHGLRKVMRQRPLNPPFKTLANGGHIVCTNACDSSGSSYSFE